MPTPRIEKDYNNETVFLTLTIIEWINIFTNKEYYEILLNSIRHCQKKKSLIIFGFVFMTNHIHLIVSSEENNLYKIIRDFKRHTTKKVKELLIKDKWQYILRLIENSFYKKKNQEFQIWQQANYPEEIHTDKFFHQKLDYIHNNPVVKGYVGKPEDWLYSSARNYYLDDHSLIKVDFWY